MQFGIGVFPYDRFRGPGSRRRRVRRDLLAKSTAAAALAECREPQLVRCARARSHDHARKSRSQMRELRGRVAVITGGGSGIGEGLALVCARQGMKVVAADIEQAEAERIAAAIRKEGGESVALNIDVSDRDSVEALARGAYEAFGSVHLLCNNAGVIVQAPIAETPLQDFQWILSVKFWGVVYAIQAFSPRMRSQEEGHIVNTASMSAVRLLDHPLGAYVASKFAVLGLSEQLRTELEPDGVGVSVLLPRQIRTRIGQAERNRPDRFCGPGEIREKALGEGMSPEHVAELVLDAVRERDSTSLRIPNTSRRWRNVSSG